MARRTGTVSELGARFDMEVDAFLILVLAINAARDFGPWVLAIGLASYALLGARRVLPWLDRPAPPRHWCKVVAAIQGVVLTVAAADVLPHAVVTALLAVALAAAGGVVRSRGALAVAHEVRRASGPRTAR